MEKPKNTEAIQTTISPEWRLRLKQYCYKNDISEAALLRRLVTRFLRGSKHKSTQN